MQIRNNIFLKITLALVMTFSANLAIAYQIQLEPTMKVDGEELKIKGQGIRTKFGFNIYLSGLYIPDATTLDKINKAQKATKDNKKSQDKASVAKASTPIKLNTAEEIIMADVPMGIRIYIMSSLVNGSRMADSTLEGFQKATNNNLGNLKNRVDLILEAFRAGVGKNTFADLIYRPGKGTEIILKNKSVMTIKGLDFKQTLFRIWLGEDPVQVHLRDAMLGKK